MLVSWKYKKRNTFLQSLDPRARLIFMIAMLFSIIYFWDLRILLVFFFIAVGQYLASRVSFRDTRFAWLILGPVFILLTIFTFLTGRAGLGVITGETIITEWQIVGNITVLVTVEKLTFAIAQFVRLFSFALLAILIPYTIDPALYGVTFRGLGLPDKFAYAMDLAFRLVPTLGRDFAITYDAQRARGYELEKLKGGLFAMIRKIAPLIVPVVIQAIVGGEEVIDAMDLRAFGLKPRTWYSELTYRNRDKILIGFSGLVFAASTVVSLAGYGNFWVPEYFLSLAMP